MLDRRGFLKFIGGAAVGTLATPVVWQGLDDISIWTQNWGWIPKLEYGNNDFTSVRTVSKICPSAVGTEVRLVGGRPIRVTGDPLSPLGRGGVSALAATEVQLRYSPARLKRPLLRSPDGGYREISWDRAEQLLVEKLEEVRAAGGKADRLVCISGDDNGTMSELFSGFAAQMGQSRFFVMPGDAQAAANAWKRMGGQGRVGFDFERSDHVLAAGANVLETWGTVISNRRAWGEAHPFGAEPSMRLVYAGPVQNNTAAGADTWLPIRPGTELYLLLGIAHQLLRDGVAVPAPGLDEFRAAVAPWTPEKACAVTGLPPALFAAAVDGLKKAKAPLVIVGSDMDQGGGAGPMRIGMAINLLLGRLNRDGGMRAIPTAPPVVRGAAGYETLMDGDLVAYADRLAQGEMPDIGLLMIHEANPLYALPGRNIAALFKKAAFSVAFSCFFDETAKHCDLILPSALGIERHDDVAQPFGFGRFLYALARPAVEPLYEARPSGETLIAVARRLGMDLGVEDVVHMLRAKAAIIGADWNALSNGDAFVSEAVLGGTGVPFYAFTRDDVAWLNREAEEGPPTDSRLRVAFVSRLALGTPETGIPPFSTKTISQNELIRDVLAANVNAATLRKLGLSNGSLVALSNSAGRILARIHVFEGVVNGTVALSMGFGHHDFDVFNDGKGMNVLDLVTPVAEAGGSGLSVWNDTRVSVAKA